MPKTLAALPRKTDAKPTPAAEAIPGRRPPVPPNDGKVAQGPEHHRFSQRLFGYSLNVTDKHDDTLRSPDESIRYPKDSSNIGDGA